MIEKIFCKVCLVLTMQHNAQLVLCNYFDSATARKIANRFVSAIHAFAMTVFCAYYLATENWTLENSTNHIDLIQSSMAYFIADSVYMFIYHPSVIFLVHHLVAFSVQAMILVTGIGSCYGLLGLFLGEITNPLQIAWLTARDNKRRFPRLYTLLTKIYIYAFMFIRCFLVPLSVVWTLYDLSKNNAPPMFTLFLGVCMISITFASFIWVRALSKIKK